MLKNLRSLKIFKVISILILFALLVGCAAVKPPSPISLNQVQSNKTGEKRGIAVVGVITWETKLVIRQNVEVTNIIKKKAKTNSVDIIEMGNIKNDQAIKNALKGHYKALILIKSDVTSKKIKYTIKVIDFEMNKMIYEETFIHKQSLATILGWGGLLIDIPTFFVLGLSIKSIAFVFSNQELEFETMIDSYKSILLPINNGIIPAIQNSNIRNKFKKPSYLCREILGGKNQKPSNLNLIVEFSDKNTYHPNNILEAGESGELTIKINNNGKDIGPAYETNLIFNSDNPSIIIESKRIIGEIAPEKSKEITIPILCDLNALDGTATITINAKEKRGYDAQPVQIVIPVGYIEKPDLVISDVKLNDANLGLAKGNGNNIPENAETIELIAYIENRGKGVALGSSLDLDNITRGINIIENHVDIGRIEPGATEKAKIVIYILREFSGNSFEYTFNVNEVRGACPTITKNGGFSIGQLSPILTYTFTFPDDLKNDGSGQITIVASNNGQLDANGVILKVNESEPEVTLENNIFNIGTLQKGKSGTPLTTTIYVQRTFSKPTLSMTIELTQDGKDFNQIIETKIIPINLIESELQIVDRSNLNEQVMQNTIGAELLLAVDNIGKLDAKDVKISVYTSVDKINFRRSMANIGTVRANASSDIEKFIFDVPQGVSVGGFTIQINVTQKDFPPVDKILNYRIKERGALITTVEPDKQNEFISISTDSGNQPSEIISNINNEQIVYSSILPINISVFDNDGISSVSINLNGKNILNSQTDQSARKSDKSIQYNTTRTDLIEGENIIEIVAEDNQNILENKTIKIIYRRTEDLMTKLEPPFSDVDIDLPKGRSNPNSAALIIGIENYQNVSPALYADRDAIAFREYCIQTLGIPEENIVFLINEKATLGQIRKGIRNLGRRTSEGGDVFVFYSGHGIPDQDGNAYLLPQDGDVDDPEAIVDVCYPMQELYNKLDKLDARHITMFIDACFPEPTKMMMPLLLMQNQS